MLTGQLSALSVHRKLLIGALATLLLWMLLSPALVSAVAGLGGYISEKLLGDGTNEALHLGDGTNEVIVLGSGPVIATLPATGVSMTGGGRATLRGNLANLNGMPQADTWFTWGYSPSGMTNTTATSTVFGTGEQTLILTGFEPKQEVYYRFHASTDGTTSGSVLSFTADTGFSMLETALPIIIALAILVFVFAATGNPIVALFGSVIGLIGFYVVKAMLESIK